MHVLIHFNVTNEKLMLVGCVEIQEAIFLETSLLEYSVHDGFLKWENQLNKQSRRLNTLPIVNFGIHSDFHSDVTVYIILAPWRILFMMVS